MDQVPLTKEGFVRLEGELKNLKSVQRPAVIQAIAEAATSTTRRLFSATKESGAEPCRTLTPA